ncbi:outer membrane protein assembly factor [Sphingobacterium sp. SRCM116780]|uniref:BamA/TamA family outer membrane protein n=1 Tax=Sphingobacterium sp. SRCM116780 TaxID=2907623 RepID=UPI001F439C83|nr:BamA/TamA family outer membrane protein [Sphingobacterium sp. SRCM116780]UIR55110.1 outer membrane protein assembly factor [Sphingobacterium sp. SRCM116780]
MQNPDQNKVIKILVSVLFIVLITYTHILKAQNIIEKVTKKVFSTERDSARSGFFMILPAFGYAQETGVEYGIASNYNFYLNKKDTSIRSSNILLMGTYTSKKQSNIKLQTDIWTSNNNYHIVSEIRYRNWPFNFYGIGMDTKKIDEDLISQKLFRAKVEVEKKIIPHYYTGVNIQYDYLQFRDKESGGIFDEASLIGKNGGQQLLIGISQLYDNRNNVSYTTKGYYARAKLAYAPKLWTKEDFEGGIFDTDLRGFFPLHQKVTLAAQAIYRATFGKTIPFYAYRDIGGDMMMRGYYIGRYKDKNYLASQAELRYRFHPRFGVTGFVGLGSVFSKEYNARFVPSYGGGLRYFFSLEHNSNIRIDYAFGEQRPGEKRQSGFYLSLSEAF